MVTKKPYVEPDSDLEITWAQRRSTPGNCEILAIFMQNIFFTTKQIDERMLESIGKKRFSHKVRHYF